MNQQLFYAPYVGPDFILSEEESQHCVRVLRYKEGDVITVANGEGAFLKSKIIDANPRGCRVTIIDREFQNITRTEFIHIAVTPTKNLNRIEWFVEKATEIGIEGITFLRCEHSERTNINLERIRKIAISAMKQSQQATLPDFYGMMSFNECVSNVSRGDGSKMIAHCNSLSPIEPIKHVYTPQEDATILIGPEGGFSDEEIDFAVSNGFTPVSLGENRLRTETAALYACQAIHILNQ